jgi:hypothetical protein
LVRCRSRFSQLSIGVWLFYVQHQFDDICWDHEEGWNFHEAALRGSLYYDLPSVLRWFAANIVVRQFTICAAESRLTGGNAGYAVPKRPVWGVWFFETRGASFPSARCVPSRQSRDVTSYRPRLLEIQVEPYAAAAAGRKRADHKAGRK